MSKCTRPNRICADASYRVSESISLRYIKDRSHYRSMLLSVSSLILFHWDWRENMVTFEEEVAIKAAHINISISKPLSIQQLRSPIFIIVFFTKIRRGGLQNRHGRAETRMINHPSWSSLSKYSEHTLAPPLACHYSEFPITNLHRYGWMCDQRLSR